MQGGSNTIKVGQLKLVCWGKIVVMFVQKMIDGLQQAHYHKTIWYPNFHIVTS